MAQFNVHRNKGSVVVWSGQTIADALDELLTRSWG